MLRYSLLFFAGLVIVSSCTIEQQFTFNSDFSGEMTQSIDYSSAKELMEMDTVQGATEELTLLPDSVVEELQKEMETINGARLISISDENYKLELKVGFDHIKALNKVLVANSESSEDTNLYCQFKRIGKSIQVEFIIEEPNKEVGDNPDQEFEMNPEGLYEMISYQFSFTFESDVKSISGTPAVLLEDGKTLLVEQNLQQFMSPDFEHILQIDLK